ncbi:GNAT family N-acetyltransferase [Roseateles asaccharophilus]|uniref:GNAT superfamily N-acetyltransferase n=1 Tax=Roseateles asaccharophilus TaxID=582607 RepID=A0ABU2AET9_9BURK|nr:GNAT family N-acetyltransferase [Roseateles asaccharophilus]MDR7335731.1 GNAT superfamily N-acetyltransferase [Roseateles asaccharophilus]
MAATLRAMTPADADAVALLHATSWRSAYRGIVPDSFLDHDVFADRQTVWRERLQGPATASAFGVVAEDASGQMIGFAYVLPGHEAECGTLIDNLHVHPDHKGGGLGRRLLQAVVRELGTDSTEPLHLWVLDQNEPAKRFYARMGAEFIDPGTTPPFGGVCLPEWRCIWRDPSTLLESA